MKQYAGHGGKVETKPLIMVLNNDITQNDGYINDYITNSCIKHFQYLFASCYLLL
jgi:hypothetical protein